MLFGMADNLKNGITTFRNLSVPLMSWRHPRFRWGPFTEDALYKSLPVINSQRDYVILPITNILQAPIAWIHLNKYELYSNPGNIPN